MPEVRPEVSREDGSRSVARAVWGLLLVWLGAALLLHWSWGVGLIGAGVILLAAQALRRYAGLKPDGFALVAGLLLVACGVWERFAIAVDLIPVLCIVAGLALLVLTWTARERHDGPGGPADIHAPSPPRG